MKKLFVLPAVLMLTTPAWAQSTAELYGLFDMGYAVSNGGTLEGANGNKGKFQQWGNGNLVSRWGLRGSEDLGNGLQVFFKLESAIQPETGASSGFNRVAMVGLSGRFGSVSVGRQQAIMDEVLADFSPSGDPSLTSANINAGVSSGQRNNRYNSMLKYISPEFGGFAFRASFVSQNDEGGVGNMDEKNLYSLAATYNWKNLTLGAAYESRLNNSPDVSSSWGISALYDFGSFRVGGGYFDNHYKEDGKGFYLGVAVPVNAWTLSAQVAYNTSAYSSVNTDTQYHWFPQGGAWQVMPVDVDRKIKPLAWELTATYTFSKRTWMYMTYGGINNDAKDFAQAERKYSVAVGVVHSF